MSNYRLIYADLQGNIKEVKLDFTDKAILRVGRNPATCDICFPDNIISGTHGEFFYNNGRVLYKDLGSTNGTYCIYGGNKILMTGKEEYRELRDKSILKIGNLNEPDKMVVLIFNEAAGNERWNKYPISSGEVSIGRDSQNQIVLNHPAVSAVHCFVRQRNGHCYLVDNRSSSGVLVNGQAINSEFELHDKDIIQILDFQLIFSNTCIYCRMSVSGIQLDICGVNKFVGRKKKQILRDVNCTIGANEFVAIVGGSGAGKSTVMNAMSGFDKNFTGQVFCNGINLIEQFQHLKNIIGYVPQQDIIYENLTLKKMLYYTAKLKMPDDASKEEIKKRIDEVLKNVDLEEHKDTFIRKLSGGQKKRASIAVELLADPKLFFLDEPTSGLDPGTEANLMKTLKGLAKEQEKTIIMVTHTTQSLHLCDKVIFMAPGGRLAFCGSIDEAKAYFETDDLVDIYNLIAERPEYWQDKFMKSHEHEAEPYDAPQDILKHGRTSWFRQFFILTTRYLELMKNDFQKILMLLIQPLLIGALLYVVADKNTFTIYESTKSILFGLSCAGIWIGIFNSIQEVCKERVIIKREYMANLKLSGYLLSKFIVQMVLGLIQSVILVMVFVTLMDVDKKGIFVDHFAWEMILTLWVTILASIAIGFFISALVKSGDKAMAVAPFVLIVQLLFSGILFTLKGAGEIISYFTISRWSVESLGSIAKLNKLDLKLQADYPMLEHKAEAFFKASKTHLLNSWGILLIMTAVLVVISIYALRSVAKDGR